MARKKRLLDDDDSDSYDESDPEFDGAEHDPIAREERELFENPYQRKKRRKKHGVFAEDSEDEYSHSRGKQSAVKRNDWTKAPAFVSSDKKFVLEQEEEVDSDKRESEHSEDDTGSDRSSGEDSDAVYSNDSESKPMSPRVREEEEEEEEAEKPRIGGIGLGPSKFPPAFSSHDNVINTSSTPVALGSDNPSAMQPKGGIGTRNTNISSASSAPAENLPSAFRKRPFFGNAAPLKPAAVFDASDMAHFSKLQGSFGARILQKMGWQSGTGLGTAGEGIVTPIESKLRPQKMGIAFKGFKEKTEQSKKEARRRGEVVSDDEDEKTKRLRKKAKEQAKKRSDVWKQPKKAKIKLEHKTYEQILAEGGQEPVGAGIGQIIDATGAVPRQLSSLADISLSGWVPSNDPTRVPEVRHNIRLIAETCKSDLDGLAREARSLDQRKKLVVEEDARLRKNIAHETELIERLQKVQLVVNDIDAKAKELASVYEVSLEPFSPLFYILVDQFSSEFERYQLDEIVVAAIAPLVRRMVASWNPLEDPTAFVSVFRTWRRALRANVEDTAPVSEVDVYGSNTAYVPSASAIGKTMTPFESLLWNIWLPRVRTYINNDWLPEIPSSAVKLYEAWGTLLPNFIRDNFLDQLILPKVEKAIANWNPRKDQVSLQSIVFPWLPHLGLRMESLLADATRKVKSLLRGWSVGDPMLVELNAWKEVIDANEWDSMLLKYIVPKLAATLRDDFRVNPRDQKMEPLQHVLQWSSVIRPSIFSQIFETEFFPKWLDVLHVWLIQPRVSFEEVAQWYSYWKSVFPENVQNMSGVGRGFTRGLQLMNKAIELGPDAPTQLARPDFRAEQSANTTSVRNGVKGATKAPPRSSALTQEITFRSIVEEFSASHNLLFIPTGRAHELSRMPLFRVSPTADGKGGVLVYILDDAVWAAAPDGEGYRAISLEDMVLRANNNS